MLREQDCYTVLFAIIFWALILIKQKLMLSVLISTPGSFVDVSFP